MKKAQKAKKDPRLYRAKQLLGSDRQIKAKTSDSHGSPLGEEEVNLVRKKLKWPYKPFEIPEHILLEWRKIGTRFKKSHIKTI